MTSRETILERLGEATRRGAEHHRELQSNDDGVSRYIAARRQDVAARDPSSAEEFEHAARLCASEVVRVSGMAAAHEAVRKALGGLDRCASSVAELDEFPRPGTCTLDELAILDALVCRGAFGVVENGAVWLPETLVESRASLFLTDSLFVILSADDLVADMHQACHRLAHGRTEGFGTFMAGPSKTADIEQALVIGAQGPRRLTIVLVDGDGEE